MRRSMLLAVVAVVLTLAMTGEAQAQRWGYRVGNAGYWDGYGNSWYAPGYGYYPYYGGPGYQSSFYSGPVYWGPTYRSSYYWAPETYVAPIQWSYPSVQPVQSTTPSPAPAMVRVLVPPDATVWIDGNPTTQTGTDRVFVSPPLQPGRRYIYQLKAQWQEKGQTVTRNLDRDVHAGDRINVDFLTASQGATTVPPRTESPPRENTPARPVQEARPVDNTPPPATPTPPQ